MSGRCTCERYTIAAPNGKTLDGELRRDPGCRAHGYPDDEWRAGDPLWRHAIRVVIEPAYQPRDHYTGRFLRKIKARTRWETPRETEARLYSEMRDAA